MVISIEHHDRKQIAKGKESAYDESQYLAESSLSKRFGCGKVRKQLMGSLISLVAAGNTCEKKLVRSANGNDENYCYSYQQMEAYKFFCCYGELSKSRALFIIYPLFLPIIFKLPGKCHLVEKKGCQGRNVPGVS
jgi:hypothetical protein